jgi:hypothetical protein
MGRRNSFSLPLVVEEQDDVHVLPYYALQQQPARNQAAASQEPKGAADTVRAKSYNYVTGKSRHSVLCDVDGTINKMTFTFLARRYQTHGLAGAVLDS